MNHVMAKDLNHISIKGNVHLWHCVNNVWKSLTNQPVLLLLEDTAFFDFEEFIYILAEENNFRKGNYCCFPDGFAFADHITKTGNFIISDGWNEAVERALLYRGYLTYKKPNYLYS